MKVLVIRDPDAATEVYTEDKASVFVLDLGGAFDGRPQNAAEARDARDYADSLEAWAVDLTGEIKNVADGWVDDLRDMADEVDTDDDL
jgi:hypothetical protein